MAVKYLDNSNKLFFSAGDVSSSTNIPELFMNVYTFHFLFRISVLLCSNGKIAASINHMKMASVAIPVGFIKATGIHLTSKDR